VLKLRAVAFGILPALLLSACGGGPPVASQSGARTTGAGRSAAVTPSSNSSPRGSAAATGPSTPGPPVTLGGGSGSGNGDDVTAARLFSAHLGLVATFNSNLGHARLWITTDSEHWRDITPPASSGGIDDGATGDFGDVYATDAQHLWAISVLCAAAHSTVWRSVDGGTSWASSSVSAPSCNYGASHIRFADALHGWVLQVSPTGPVEGLSSTTDGGQTWTDAGRMPGLGDITFYSPTDGYGGGFNFSGVYGTSDLYGTHDAGRTWAQVSVNLPADLAGWQPSYGVPTFVDAMTGVLPVTLVKGTAQDVAMYATADAGSTWSLASGPRSLGIADSFQAGSPGLVPVATTSVPGSRTWWAIGNSAHRIWTQVTNDGGATWTSVTGGTWSGGMQLTAANATTAWLLAGGGALLATNDGGSSWSSLWPPGQAASSRG
jgi:photosystem II stability/assembly factor-like uncharacterized protein